MTLSDFASIATVISSGAVLISLIYLGLQTRQNTRHMRAQIQQARNREIIESEMRYVNDPLLRGIIIRGDAADPTLTADQVRTYLHYISSQLMLTEDFFYQHRAGLIDAERHATTILAIKNTRARHPGFRAAWKICKYGLGLEFQTFVETLIAEVQPRPASDVLAVWHRLTAAERAQMATGEHPAD